ncbi:hypothetical protein BJ742DRAFT_825025 [Cladochytrium replicatum]|nr:hypothetical protein BJ742DRAFT_825025 [Cladochytrium replicatum]
MNMGATLTVVQQPQQAFHVYAVIAASLEKEPTPRMPSGRSAVVIGDLSKHKLPKWLSTALYLNMYINVAQLERIQFENSHDNNFIPRSHNDLYPGRGQDVAYVKSLFQLLDNSVELPEFENLTPGSAEVIESSVQEIVRNFVESTRDWSYETGTTSLNVPVVEEDHVNDDDAGDEIGLGVHTSVMRGWDHPPRLSGCKAYATSEVLSTAKDKCVQGIRLLQWHPGTHEVGTEYIRDGLNKISTLRVGSRNATERVEWVVEGLERLLDESGQGNGLGQSSLIALVADIVGYGCVYAPELLELFGIETEVHGQEVRRLLVRGSAVLSAAALGVCEGCMAAIVSRVQAGGEDLGRLYVGLGSLESSNPSGGWPCEHFPSQYFVFR